MHVVMGLHFQTRRMVMEALSEPPLSSHLAASRSGPYAKPESPSPGTEEAVLSTATSHGYITGITGSDVIQVNAQRVAKGTKLQATSHRPAVTELQHFLSQSPKEKSPSKDKGGNGPREARLA